MKTNKRTISRKESLYGICIFSFLLGIITGAIFANYIDNFQNDELIQYMNHYFIHFNAKAISHSILLKQALFNHGKTFILIWIFGLGVAGIPFIVINIFLKGFSYGFTSAFLFIHYGVNGLLFSLLSFLPQSFLLVPGMILISAASMNFALSGSNHKNYHKDKKEKWSEYLLVLLVGLVIAVIISMMETFISPLLINIIIKRMSG
ncbi:MAG: stage II sporulation protein M [Epulopiscium sp.]|nr:stage II sporulation protein M [Candidatus Epulonipiscium sp.]HOQ16159.1 stage II sporulation protein M [Defluviitaleaceae bacterium]HPT76194.1 stage II sporulation protein M [Defluviitaleaceae bacterium]